MYNTGEDVCSYMDLVEAGRCSFLGGEVRLCLLYIIRILHTPAVNSIVPSVLAKLVDMICVLSYEG